VTILVDSRTPVNFEMVAPVVRAMACDPRVTFAFTASEEPRRLAEIYEQAPPGTRLIGPARAALSKWDVYLTSDYMWATLPRGCARVQMFHGVAGKYGFDAPTEPLHGWDRLFFINQRRLDNVLAHGVAHGVIDADSDAPRLIGMPKVDVLVDGTLERNQVLDALDLNPALPTVLYAPTWSPASSLNALGVALVQRLLAMPLNVIVKLHDRSRDVRPQYSGGVDWISRLAPLLAVPNGHLATGANVTTYLAAADVMITDHSSAGFEYLLLDRPVVRLEMPDLLAQAKVHPDYAQLLADCAETVTGVGDAAAAVERALANPLDRSATRTRVAAELFYKAGTATARCAAALYEVAQLAPDPSILLALAEPKSCLKSA
jgi:hypothetical protein